MPRDFLIDCPSTRILYLLISPWFIVVVSPHYLWVNYHDQPLGASQVAQCSKESTCQCRSLRRQRHRFNLRTTWFPVISLRQELPISLSTSSAGFPRILDILELSKDAQLHIYQYPDERSVQLSPSGFMVKKWLSNLNILYAHLLKTLDSFL